MTKSKNLQKIKIARTYKKQDTAGLCKTSNGIKLTGDADATTPPVTDTVLKQKATALLATNSLRQTDRSQATTDLEIQQKNDLIRQLDKDASYVEGVANDVAVAKGDVAAGEAVVTRIGFQLKKRGVAKPRDFEQVKSDPGTIHLHVKKAKPGIEGHLWRYGGTTAKDTPPPATALKLRVTVESDIILGDLTSGSIIAAQHASVVGVSHTKKTGAATSFTSKAASSVATNKAKHPVFSDKQTDPYNWTGFIYVVVP
jgi:hypothetical protein